MAYVKRSNMYGAAWLIAFEAEVVAESQALSLEEIPSMNYEHEAFSAINFMKYECTVVSSVSSG